MAGSKGDQAVINRVNKFPLSREEMTAFIKGIEKIPREDRCFEVHTITAIQVFKNDSDKAFSVMFRMEAVARIIEQGILPGWCREPTHPDDPWSVRETIFAAAGITPVCLDEDGKVSFDKDELLKAAFQLGKAENKEDE